MNNYSPSGMAKQIDNQISRTLRSFDISKLDLKQRELLARLSQDLSEVKTYSTDYELSETRQEQGQNAGQARKYLNRVQKEILTASQFDIFNAIDVAHLSAQIGHLTERLK